MLVGKLEYGFWKFPLILTKCWDLLRARELQATEPANGTMVSVGCNGLEYFD